MNACQPRTSPRSQAQLSDSNSTILLFARDMVYSSRSFQPPPTSTRYSKQMDRGTDSIDLFTFSSFHTECERLSGVE